jgi:benzodiazapine receptor
MTDTAELAEARATQPGLVSLIPFLLAALLLAALGVATTTPAVSDWFRAGPRVPWTPALTAVTVIWTTLDLLNGLAGWLIWRARSRRSDAAAVFLLWCAQYVLQVLWLVAFMAQSLVDGGLLWVVFALVVLLDLTTAAAAFAAWRVSRPAGLMLVVILAWLLYGTALSWGDTALRILNGL